MPYTPLALALLLLTELIVYAPLKYRIATVCMSAVDSPMIENSQKHNTYKAVALQLWYWKTRLVRYTFVFIPAAFFSILSDRFTYTASDMLNPYVMSMVLKILSFILLIVGVFIVECGMFRYMAAWYLLPFVNNYRQAIQGAKKLSQYHRMEIAALCLQTQLLLFSIERAGWIAQQLRCSKHAYNFMEKTHTDIGRMNAKT